MWFQCVHERLLTNESVCRCSEVAFENKASQIYNPMDGSLEANCYWETHAVVSDVPL